MMKRFFALLLAAMLCLGAASPVFAQGLAEDTDRYTTLDSTNRLDENAEDTAKEATDSKAEDLSDELTDSGTPDLSGGVVSEFYFEQWLNYDRRTYKTTALDDLYSDMAIIEDSLGCVVELEGVEYEAACTATWNIDELDLTIPGEYDVIATLVPPMGCTLGEGVRTQVVLPILIKEPSTQEIIGIFNQGLYEKGIMLAVGDHEKWEAEKAHCEEFISGLAVGITADGDEARLVLERFDSDDVDIDTPGEYFVTVTLRLGENEAEDFTISDAVRTLQIPVKISIPTDFDLWLGDMSADFFNLYTIMKLEEHPSVLWTSSELFLDDAQLNTAEWSDCPEGVISGLSFDGFSITREELIQNRYYYFRLQSETLYSNIVYICDDGTYVDYGYTGGDRDGGDGNGFKPPTVTQPGPGDGADSDSGSGSDSGSAQPPETDTTPNPPETSKPTPEPEPSVPPDTTPTPEPEPSVPPTTVPDPLPQAPEAAATKQPGNPIENKPVIMEAFGETVDVISGTRLRMMLETGGARFSKQGVMVTLSDATLAAMRIQDSESFTVEIKRSSDSSFAFYIAQNDVPLSSLPDTQILLAYQMKDDMTALTLQNEQGGLVCDGSLDKTTGIASFTVDTTGSFTIAEVENAAPAAMQPDPPISTEPTSPSTTEPLPQQPSPSGMSGAAVATASAIVLLAAGGGIWLYRKRRWVR